jgi:hypothetical protein
LDDIYLSNSISYSQDAYLQSTLGESLYTRVVNEIYSANTFSTSATTEVIYLLQSFIKDIVMYGAEYEAFDSLYTKIMQTSVVIKNDSKNSKALDKDYVDQLKSRVMSMLEFYCERCRKYLITQSGFNLFPEYISYQANYDTIIPNTKTGYGKQGFYFKRKGKTIMYGPGRCFHFGNAFYGYDENMGNR